MNHTLLIRTAARWRIPRELALAVLARDLRCIYCNRDFEREVSHIELLTTHSTYADISNVVTDNNMRWNERLKLAREKRGLNKSQMSRLAGVSKATTTFWESGSIKMIDGEHLVKVASVLKVTPEWLIGGTEELPEGFAYGNGQPCPSLLRCLTRHSSDSQAIRCGKEDCGSHGPQLGDG